MIYYAWLAWLPLWCFISSSRCCNRFWPHYLLNPLPIPHPPTAPLSRALLLLLPATLALFAFYRFSQINWLCISITHAASIAARMQRPHRTLIDGAPGQRHRHGLFPIVAAFSELAAFWRCCWLIWHAGQLCCWHVVANAGDIWFMPDLSSPRPGNCCFWPNRTQLKGSQAQGNRK